MKRELSNKDAIKLQGDAPEGVKSLSQVFYSPCRVEGKRCPEESRNRQTRVTPCCAAELNKETNNGRKKQENQLLERSLQQ